MTEVCQVFETPIGDGERVYDLRLVDDQLVLGIKATMSVAEIQVLRLRLVQGMREKLAGEPVRLLPPGYVRDGMGTVVKDPDRRVQQAVDLVFHRFRETWSVRQTFTWFHDEGIDLPVNKSTGGEMRLVWRPPTHAFIADLLHNPFYAGAYVFGRRPIEIILAGASIRRQRSYALAPEDCSVFCATTMRGRSLGDVRGTRADDSAQCPLGTGRRGGGVDSSGPGAAGRSSPLRPLRSTTPRSLLGEKRDLGAVPLQRGV